MTKSQNTNIDAKWILISFIVFNIISYLYVSITGRYNGDFLGEKTRLSDIELFFNFSITILPFFVLFAIYKYYKRVNNKYKITIQHKNFGLFLFIVIVFQIIVTQLYGVGKLGQDIYNVPGLIKIFIQIFNRFNVVLGISIYSIVVGRKNRFQYLLWLLVIVLSILRSSLSIFVIICFIQILLNQEIIIKYIKKYFIAISVFIIIAPIIVSTLYNVRNQLREKKNNIEIKVEDENNDSYSYIIFGRLVGRLSSFTNSAIIQERKYKLIELTSYFSTYQYPKEAFAAVYGKFMNPKDMTYSNLIYESFGNHTRTYSSMNGSQGMLTISYYQSFWVFFINLSTIMLITILSFELISLLHYDKINEVVFLFSCLSVMSGDASEFMSKLMFIVLYLTLFLFLNLIKIKI